MRLNKNKKCAIFPGSFDPFHIGHEFVINSAIKDKFNKIYIVISWNEKKIRKYTFQESFNLIENIYGNNPKIEILINKNKLTVEIARELNCFNIIRGYRNKEDFLYEESLKKMYIDKEPKINFILYKSNINISSKKIKNDII